MKEFRPRLEECLGEKLDHESHHSIERCSKTTQHSFIIHDEVLAPSMAILSPADMRTL